MGRILQGLRRRVKHAPTHVKKHLPNTTTATLPSAFASEGLVVEELEASIKRMKFQRDKGQFAAASELDSLLVRWKHETDSTNGVYLYGSVGTGKTMLMDCFHRVVHRTFPLSNARRTHFHDFMIDVHQKMHHYKDMDVVARVLAENEILCFDEFQVTDVADAAILHRLFEALFERGTIVVATSNRAPEELYTNGINREAVFVPFERLLLERCQVVNINAIGQGKDYRVECAEKTAQQELLSVVFAPASDENVTASMEELFQGLADEERGRCSLGQQIQTGDCQSRSGRTVEAPSPVSIPVAMGRELRLDSRVGGVARTSFRSLCEKPVGSADFISLASEFHTLILENVPALSQRYHNETRRFITLIDILYDRDCLLVVSSENSLATLFQDVGGVTLGPDHRVDTDSMMDIAEEEQLLKAHNARRASKIPSSPPRGGGVTTNSRESSGPKQRFCPTEAAKSEIKIIGEGGASGRSTTMLSDNVEWSSTGRVGVSLAELASVEDVAFAFRRALSRLVEMQTPEYRRRNRARRERMRLSQR